MAAASTGPAPVSLRDRSASKVTGLTAIKVIRTISWKFVDLLLTHRSYKLIMLFAEATIEPVASRCMPVVSWQDSGLVTAQCEFCLRRYLKSAMSTHLQVSIFPALCASAFGFVAVRVAGELVQSWQDAIRRM